MDLFPEKSYLAQEIKQNPGTRHKWHILKTYCALILLWTGIKIAKYVSIYENRQILNNLGVKSKFKWNYCHFEKEDSYFPITCLSRIILS